MQFPPFVPDDPEMPHLSSRKKEKARQQIISDILRKILKYNKSEYGLEAMTHQSSMFDGDEPLSKKLWRKLALNLLYARPSKNILHNYAE